MVDEFPPCPKCGNHNFKVWRLPHPAMLHWVLNPGLVVNELLLGQRVPKVQLFCESCEGALLQRSYIPCPNCKTMNGSGAWRRRDSFWHWLGLVCPNCGKRIPSLWNLFSLVLLAITSPLWYLPYRLYFRDRNAARPIGNPNRPPVSKRLWIALAVFWGFFMWLLMSALPVGMRVYRGEPPRWYELWIGLVIWSIGGAAFGYMMQRTLGKMSPASPEGTEKH
jgi:hypothetical protein